MNDLSHALIGNCNGLMYGFLGISVLMKRMAADSAFSSKARRMNLFILGGVVSGANSLNTEPGIR